MNGPASYCDGIKRRDLLRVGVAGMTGAALPLSQLLQSQAAADAKGEKNDVSL
ncbi:MAG: DUF1501 domain-containing protein, partial [Planctomycetaceae bacterium]|nr:DUF1501 domain-containing protein [Planctomycetaceae bacterium]